MFLRRNSSGHRSCFGTGIDLAKNLFQVHGIDEHGKVLAKKQLRRDQMATFFVNVPPCLVGMLACGSAHHWARKPRAMGHTVRLMAPQFVKPYVKTNKNDAADAEAICEAVVDRTCASCRSRMLSSRRCWRCTGCARAS
jgi:transposase